MSNKSFFPQGQIKTIEGRCLTLKGDDIDTDRIIPARFLKCVSFDALGEQVFADDRIQLNGSHPFDQKINKGASILIVNDNFGCGSSREHAPQALMRWGIRAVIGQSFAEIFYGNCLVLGIPCATATTTEINRLQNTIDNNPNHEWSLNVRNQTLSSEVELLNIQIETGAQEMLLSGQWDATSQLMDNQLAIENIMKELPYINNFQN